MRILRVLYRCFAVIFSAGVMGILSCALYLDNILPSHFYVEEGRELQLGKYQDYLTCTIAADDSPIEVYGSLGDSYRMNLRLLGAVNVKDVSVQVVDRRCVVPCGAPFGIKMFTDGVMVVGMGDIQTQDGLVNPAKEAGIEIGDIIVEMNGQMTMCNKDIARIVEQSAGGDIQVVAKRDGYLQNLLMKAVQTPTDQTYRIGLWVRDSSAGIGTMTYYDPEAEVFAGLGHAICDIDTQDIMPLYEGEVVDAVINSVNKGAAGEPGELHGSFSETGRLGELAVNNQTGVFGYLDREPNSLGQLIPMAFSYEAEQGPATIFTTISGSTPKEYTIEIERINYSDNEPAKNMIIRITDPELLAETGGIVQGMSGSPIIQNGMLIGAVTHVFVNDPTKGYAIFAENMDKTLCELSENRNIA